MNFMMTGLIYLISACVLAAFCTSTTGWRIARQPHNMGSTIRGVSRDRLDNRGSSLHRMKMSDSGLASSDRRVFVSGIGYTTFDALVGSTTSMEGAEIFEQSLDKNGKRFTTLQNGARFPLASFGLQEDYDEEIAEQLTLTALKEGYRNIFCSELTGCQRGVAQAICSSGVPREQIFVCGSVDSSKAASYKEAFAATLQRLDRNFAAFKLGGIDYLDMVMLDNPGPTCDAIRGQWDALENHLAEKRTRGLAVSNFLSDQLDCILSIGGRSAHPLVNQQAFNAGLYSRSDAADLLSANLERGLILQAWSPLAGGRLPRAVRRTCGEIGRRYGKSAYQVALRWIVQSGAAFTVSSRSVEHLHDDCRVFDFELTAEEMVQVGSC